MSTVVNLKDILADRMGDLALENTPGLQARFDAKVDKTSVSDAINSNSSLNVASSKAVKTAYDRASTAINTANVAETAANQALSSWSNLPNAKSDAVNLADSNSLATSAAVKTAYDRGNSAHALATTANNTANTALSKWNNLPNAKSDSVTLNSSSTLATSKAVYTLKGQVDTAQAQANKGVADAAAARSHADSLFANKSDSVSSTSSATLATSRAVKTAYDKKEASLFYSSTAKVTATSSGASVAGTLTTTGAITSSSNVTAYSDRRLKSNIMNLGAMGEAHAAIRGKRYVRNLDGQEDIGFIAQDVQKYFPELVLTHEDGTLSLNYMGMVAVLWEIVRELVYDDSNQ